MRNEFMLLETFLKYIAGERNYSPLTVRNYRADLEAFKQFFKTLDETLTWETMHGDIIRRWLSDMLEKGNSATSVNRRLSSLRTFYKYLLATEVIATDPTAKIQGPKKLKTLPSFVKEAEMNRLLDDIPVNDTFEGRRNHAIINTFYNTGMRLSELTSLNVSSIDLNARIAKVTGKRNKERVIPFGKELHDELQQYIIMRRSIIGEIPCEAFFISPHGERLSNVEVRNIVKEQLSLVTSMKKRTPHVLRHTFATSMLNHDADLEVVRRLLGHASLSTTEVYTHTTFEELKRIYDKAHPRA